MKMKESELRAGQTFENECGEWLTIDSIQNGRIYFTVCYCCKDQCDIEFFPGLREEFRLVNLD